MPHADRVRAAHTALQPCKYAPFPVEPQPELHHHRAYRELSRRHTAGNRNRRHVAKPRPPTPPHCAGRTAHVRNAGRRLARCCFRVALKRACGPAQAAGAGRAARRCGRRVQRPSPCAATGVSAASASRRWTAPSAVPMSTHNRSGSFAGRARTSSRMARLSHHSDGDKHTHPAKHLRVLQRRSPARSGHPATIRRCPCAPGPATARRSRAKHRQQLVHQRLGIQRPLPAAQPRIRRRCVFRHALAAPVFPMPTRISGSTVPVRNLPVRPSPPRATYCPSQTKAPRRTGSARRAAAAQESGVSGVAASTPPAASTNRSRGVGSALRRPAARPASNAHPARGKSVRSSVVGPADLRYGSPCTVAIDGTASASAQQGTQRLCGRRAMRYDLEKGSRQPPESPSVRA